MRIERIEALPLRMPLGRPLKAATALITHRCTVLVRIHAGGLTGECFANNEEMGQAEIVRLIEQEITPRLLGRDPWLVEAKLYEHPAVREACVIGAADAYRGETVKAVIALRDGAPADADGIIAWARQQMAAYKVPRIIEFVDALPKSPVGKILWRDLQDREKQKESET